MTPEQKNALQTIIDSDLGFDQESDAQINLQELQNLAGQLSISGVIGSDFIELSENLKENLNEISKSIPVLIESYLSDIAPIAKKAARVAELIAPGAEGNPQNEEWRDEEVSATLESIHIDSQSLMGNELAQISYFKNLVQRENNKLMTEIEFIYRTNNKDITQKEVKDLKDRLEVVARLPEMQPSKLLNQQESFNEEISKVIKACSVIIRGE